MITVVRLERWVCFLVVERVRLPLPLEPLLLLDLRRANPRYPTFCRSIQTLNIHTLKDVALIYESQELVSIS
jgi:hypothetical protein